MSSETPTPSPSTADTAYSSESPVHAFVRELYIAGTYGITLRVTITASRKGGNPTIESGPLTLQRRTEDGRMVDVALPNDTDSAYAPLRYALGQPSLIPQVRILVSRSCLDAAGFTGLVFASTSYPKFTTVQVTAERPQNDTPTDEPTSMPLPDTSKKFNLDDPRITGAFLFLQRPSKTWRAEWAKVTTRDTTVLEETADCLASAGFKSLCEAEQASWDAWSGLMD